MDGVDCIHKKGLIHKDLKLENVMLDEVAKIVDYNSLKNINFVVGSQSVVTPFYVAPEIKKGVRPTDKVDIFSIGLMMFQCK